MGTKRQTAVAVGAVGKWESRAFGWIPTFPPARRPAQPPYNAAAMSAPYFVLVREMRDAYNHRLRLVQSARQGGIKPTARLFHTTVPTVRKWLRRFQQQGLRGLIEISRAPRHQPGKTPPAVEQQVVALRQQLPTFGADSV